MTEPTPEPTTRRELTAARRRARHWAMLAVGACLVAILVLLYTLVRHDGGLGPRGGLAAARGPEGCASPVPVRVVVTPDMEPVIDGLRDRMQDDCVTYDVVAQSPAATLASLRDPGARPHLWISDSSVQLTRARSQSPDLQLTGGAAFASSPIIAALPRASATSDRVGWSDLVADPGDVHLTDPMTTSTGLLALLSAAGTGPRPGTTTPSATAPPPGPVGLALREAASHGAPATTVLPSAAPEKASGVYLVSEQQFFRFGTDHPTSPLVAVEPSPGTLGLDYRAVPLPTTDPRIAQAVQALTEALTTEDTRQDVRNHGFRVPGDAHGPSVRTRAGESTVSTTGLALPGERGIRSTIAQWQSITSGMRLLALVDTSGSMRHGDTGSGNRIELAARAAIGGATALPPNTDLGLWEFSTGAGKRGDWRELAPIAPLVDHGNPAHRDRLVTAVRALPTSTGRDTPLYDVLLAAVQRLHTDYDPRRVQAVVVMTDGRNDVPDGLDLPGLISALQLQNVSGREVYVVAIAIGPDADQDSLRKVADATHGAFYYADRPEDIEKVISSALMSFTPVTTGIDPLP